MKQKDPAFLFYFVDYQHGTRKFTFEEKGAYMELLCEQADSGHLSLQDIERILSRPHTIWDTIWDTIRVKFIMDADGNYFNEVLEERMNQRKKFTESRKRNLMGIHMKNHMDVHMDTHMGNENGNGNINKDGVKGKERTVTSANIPTMDEVVSYFKSCGFTEEDGKNFWSHFESIGWEDTRGRRITNWNARVILWMNQSKQFTPKDEKKTVAQTDFNLKKNKELKKQFTDNDEKIKREGKFTSFKEYLEPKPQPEKKGTKQ